MSASIMYPAPGITGEQLHEQLKRIGARVPKEVLGMGHADSVEAWMRALGISRKALQRRMYDHGYVPPGKYLIVRRLVGALLEMEAGSNATVAAIRNGYAAVHDFSQQCMRYLDARPSALTGGAWHDRVRAMLGATTAAAPAAPSPQTVTEPPAAGRTEYEIARDRVLAKRAGQMATMRVDLRARRLLNIAGWRNATAEQLRAAAAELPECDRIEDDMLDAAVTRALELMNDENVIGRRVPPEEMPMPNRIMTDEQREKVMRFARDRRAQSPNISAAKVHGEAMDTFDLAMSLQTFYNQIWTPLGKRSNGKGKRAAAAKETAARVEPKPKRTPASTAADTTPPPVAAVAPPSTPLPAEVPQRSQSGTPEVVGSPILQILPLSDGRVRIQIDTDFELAGALTLLAATIANRDAA